MNKKEEKEEIEMTGKKLLYMFGFAVMVFLLFVGISAKITIFLCTVVILKQLVNIEERLVSVN